MKIEKIKLHNFRQFSGDTIVEFSTDKLKNITVIHAMNGSGKTTFLQAFYWALYENINLSNSSRLINEYVFSSMNEGDSTEVFIEITATHEGEVYVIKRKINVTKEAGEKMKNSKAILELMLTDKKGKSKSLKESEAQHVINLAIPEKLAKYFFFDGERIKSLGENNAKARNDIANGIKNILNISTFDELKRVLEKKVLVSFKNEIKLENTTKSNNLVQRKNDIISNIEELEQKRIEKNNYKEEIDLRLEELNINISKNEVAVEYKNRLNINRESIKKAEIEIKDIIYPAKNSKKDSLPKAYTKVAISNLLNMLRESVELNLDISKVDNNLIPGVNAEAVDKILEIERCICGRHIGKEEKIELENLRQYLPPHDQRMLVHGYKERYRERVESFKNIEEEKENIMARYFQLKEDVYKLTTENRELNKKIDSVDDVKDYNTERNDKEIEKEDILKKIGKIDFKIEDLQRELQGIEKEINKCEMIGEQNDKINSRIIFVEKMIKILDKNIENKKKEIHEKLKSEVNSIFSSVAHKNTKEVIIEENYSYKIRDKATQHEALSEGESVITSLSFIAAIIKIAKDLEEQKKKEVEEGVEYPLVLDAPFAKLDSIHIKGIAPVLHKFADQVILFTVDQQFKGVTEGNIIDSIGVEYDMRNNMDREVIIERIR